MDRFFGLDTPALQDEGLSLLTTLYDDVLVELFESLLKEENIPYLKKDRSGGTAIRIIMGSNPYGTDIYVADSSLARARALLIQDPDTPPTEDEDRVYEEIKEIAE